MSSNESFMRRALELAERGRGHVEPNPMVGAVLVRDGQIVGEGFHEKYGQAHAEVNAIAVAGQKAKGATLYVTLEPCCHQGKTPPCTDAVIKAGITKVVAAMRDPFPQVAGKGATRLEGMGIPCSFGPFEAEARALNAPYLTLLSQGRPYVHAKWAMTLDGKIATRTGDSKWISNEASRRKGHELRGRMDGIVVGIGSALADDPLLTARPPGPRVPVRVVLDSMGRMPMTAQLVRTARESPTMIVVGSGAASGRRDELRSAGCEVIVAAGEDGRVDISAWLTEMGRRRWTNILVEGGGAVLGSFFDAGCIDEAHVFVAPKIIGGVQARTPVGSLGIEWIKEALEWEPMRVELIEGDIYLQTRCISALGSANRG